MINTVTGHRGNHIAIVEIMAKCRDILSTKVPASIWYFNQLPKFNIHKVIISSKMIIIIAVYNNLANIATILKYRKATTNFYLLNFNLYQRNCSSFTDMVALLTFDNNLQSVYMLLINRCVVM